MKYSLAFLGAPHESELRSHVRDLATLNEVPLQELRPGQPPAEPALVLVSPGAAENYGRRVWLEGEKRRTLGVYLRGQSFGTASPPLALELPREANRILPLLAAPCPARPPLVVRALRGGCGATLVALAWARRRAQSGAPVVLVQIGGGLELGYYLGREAGQGWALVPREGQVRLEALWRSLPRWENLRYLSGTGRQLPAPSQVRAVIAGWARAGKEVIVDAGTSADIYLPAQGPESGHQLWVGGNDWTSLQAFSGLVASGTPAFGALLCARPGGLPARQCLEALRQISPQLRGGYLLQWPGRGRWANLRHLGRWMAQGHGPQLPHLFDSRADLSTWQALARDLENGSELDFDAHAGGEGRP